MMTNGDNLVDISTMNIQREWVLNKINIRLKELGWSRRKLAIESGVPYHNIVDFFRPGKSTLPRADKLQKIFDVLGISERPPIPVEGVILDGQIFPVDEWRLTNHVGQLTVDKESIKMIAREKIYNGFSPPMPGALGDMVSIVVSDDSELPLLPRGSYIYYDRGLVKTENFDDLIDEHCIVHTTDDKILMRFLHRGHLPGKFNLLSYKGVLVQNMVIKWAAPIYGYCPARKRGESPRPS